MTKLLPFDKVREIIDNYPENDDVQFVYHLLNEDSSEDSQIQIHLYDRLKGRDYFKILVSAAPSNIIGYRYVNRFDIVEYQYNDHFTIIDDIFTSDFEIMYSNESEYGFTKEGFCQLLDVFVKKSTIADKLPLIFGWNSTTSTDPQLKELIKETTNRIYKQTNIIKQLAIQEMIDGKCNLYLRFMDESRKTEIKFFDTADEILKYINTFY